VRFEEVVEMAAGSPIEFWGTQVPDVAPSERARLYFDVATGKLKCSVDGQAYQDVTAPDASNDLLGLRNFSLTGSISQSGGAAAPVLIQRIGSSATEGWERWRIDETLSLTNAISKNLTTAIPANSVIEAVQMNLQKLVVGDGTGDDGLVKVGIGIAATPDKYGKTASLLKNQKVSTHPAFAVLDAGEQLCVKGCDTDGVAVTEKFVASAAAVRAVVIYKTLNDLDDA
jgi:hypothetical protein